MYKHFVRHTLGMLSQTDYTVYVYVYPVHDKESLLGLLRDETPVFPQEGRHLGERMKNAMDDAFSEGFDKALLVGTDIPDLKTEIINDAVDSLNEYQAVIGPSTDGGYYLIGFHSRGFLPDIFTGMPWGTSRVLKKTMAVFKSKNMDVFMLNPCRDIDTYDDLHAFLIEETTKKDRYREILKKINPGGAR